MAYDEFLAERIKTILNQKHITFEEKKMMGGLCYLVKGKMCSGIVRNTIEPEGIDNDCDLEYWIGKCLEFNPKAKSSKKKR